MTVDPLTYTDPVALALLESEKVVLGEGAIQTHVHGRWLDVTRHALAQFYERLDERAGTRDLFPHLDLDEELHRIAAIYTLLNESEPGTIQNRHREVVPGFRSERWFFVLDRPGGLIVVTCYPSRGAFYPDE